MIKSLLFYLLVFIPFISCKDEQDSSTPDLDYKSYLLKNQDSVPTFNFPVTTTTEGVFDVIDDYTQQDCFERFHFNYQIKDVEIQSVALEYCNTYPPIAHYKILYLETFGEAILLDNGKTDETEILTKSKAFFEELNDIKSHYFIVYQSNKTSNNFLEQVFTDLVDGYFEYAKEKFFEEYGIKISEASKSNLDQFKSNNTFNIMFNANAFKIPPPPPPPPAPSAEDFN